MSLLSEMKSFSVGYFNFLLSHISKIPQKSKDKLPVYVEEKLSKFINFIMKSLSGKKPSFELYFKHEHLTWDSISQFKFLSSSDILVRSMRSTWCSCSRVSRKTSVRARWQSMLRNIMCMRIQMCQTILVTSPTFVLDIMVLKTYISRCSARINGQWANFWCSFAISPSLYHRFAASPAS